MMGNSPSPLLEIPFEIRQAIYEQLLFNFIIHPCPDEHQLNHHHARPCMAQPPPTRGRTPGDFHDDLMICSGRHYQSLIKPGKWSNVYSPSYPFKASDILHFMLTCKSTYLELEPLLWSRITLATSLPSFGTFFERYLSIPLRSRSPRFIPRADVLTQLILALPRIDELASEMGHSLQHYRLDADAYVEQKAKQSLDHLTRSCPSLRSLRIVMDATQLECTMDDNQIIAYARHDIETVLRFQQQGLDHFAVTYSGELPASRSEPQTAALTVLFEHALAACERALWEMVTRKGEPLDPRQDRTGWLGDRSIFANDDRRLREFCERAIRSFNVWWLGVSVEEELLALKSV